MLPSTVLFTIVLFILIIVLIYFLKASIIKRDYAVSIATQRQMLAEKIEQERKQKITPIIANANTWRNFTNFRVKEKKIESWTIHNGKQVSDICSFILEPVDTPVPLPSFAPGQHLSFLIDTPGHPTTMYYSLSDGPNANTYRVSIKRALPPPRVPSAPPGKGSNFFHDKIHQGSLVKTALPKGDFYLDYATKSSAILIAGGIGITPMISMARALADRQSSQEVILYYGMRNLSEAVLLDDLLALSRDSKSFTCYLCLSDPQTGLQFDEKANNLTQASGKIVTKIELDGSSATIFRNRKEQFASIELDPNIHIVTGFDAQGILSSDLEGKGCRVSVSLMKHHLEPENKDYDFYLCGPPPMMKSIVTDLYHWNLPKERVHWEGFGPCAVMWPGDILNSPLKPCTVTFMNSERDEKIYLDWKPANGSLMNMADEKSDQVPKIPRSCGAGFCGTCKTTFKGKVAYEHEPGYANLQANECLPCICKPDGDIIIDVK